MIQGYKEAAGEERKRTQVVSSPEVAGIFAGNRVGFHTNGETLRSDFPLIVGGSGRHSDVGMDIPSRLGSGSSSVGGRKVVFQSGRVGGSLGL